jgi:hypothetical protein
VKGGGGPAGMRPLPLPTGAGGGGGPAGIRPLPLPVGAGGGGCA